MLSAASAGDIDALKEELSKGADINAVTGPSGWTPLIFACENNRLEAVKFLIEHKATVDKADAAQSTRELLILNCSANLLCLAALHWACFQGHVEIASVLLDNGADINKPGRYGATALINAVNSNEPSCVKLLLERKADTTVKPSSGRFEGETALDIAKEKKLDGIVALLQSASSSIPSTVSTATAANTSQVRLVARSVLQSRFLLSQITSPSAQTADKAQAAKVKDCVVVITFLINSLVSRLFRAVGSGAPVQRRRRSLWLD